MILLSLKVATGKCELKVNVSETAKFFGTVRDGLNSVNKFGCF